ncbi:MAG: hypothetical protein ACQGVC_07510 [Myxococcota bacterium]
MAAESREQRMLFEARRHLAGIGVQTQFTARGDALKGQMVFRDDQVLRNPGGGGSIESIRFTVKGDGSIHIDDPANLSDLEGLPAATRLGSVEAMSTAIRHCMDKQFTGMRGLGNKLRAFGLRVENDAERMVLVAQVDLEKLGVAVLESDGAGLVARQLRCETGEVLAFPNTPIDLAQFDDRIDLELFLAGEAERLAPDRVKDVVVSGHQAVRAEDTELFGVLTPEVTDIVAGLTPPLEGQTWVMDVIVESDDGEEVRYRGVGFTGQAFGAPRVLPKIAFEASYHPSGQTHRMLVQVTHVDEENVGYVKLDGDRRPVGGERKVALVGFLANFTQEPVLG